MSTRHSIVLPLPTSPETLTMPSSLGDGVEQRLERRAAVGALKEEIGVRGDAKGRLFQPEMV